MPNIKVVAKVCDCESAEKSDIEIESNWGNSKKIMVTIGSESREVFGDDLKKAIENCMNTGV